MTANALGLPFRFLPANRSIGPEIAAAPAGSEDLGNRDGRHRDAIGGPLGLEPVPRALLDHEIDEFEPLGIVGGFRQQPFITMIVVARIPLTHGTPRTRPCPERRVSINARARATALRRSCRCRASYPPSVAELIRHFRTRRRDKMAGNIVTVFTRGRAG